jgi:transposase-like protein
MSLQNLEQFKFTDEFKEKLVLMVVYHNHSPESLVKKYGLPNIYMLANWVSIYKRSLEKGAVTLPPMQSQKRKDAAALKQRIKQLEKSGDSGDKEHLIPKQIDHFFRRKKTR